MASGANNSVNLLSASPRVSDSKSTRDVAQNSSADFGAQFKNELNKAQAKPAENTSVNKSADQSNKGQAGEEVSRPAEAQVANSPANKGKEASAAQTDEADEAQAQSATPLDANLLALISASQAMPLATPTTMQKTTPELIDSADLLAESKTDTASLANLGKLSSAIASSAEDGKLMQGDAQQQSTDQPGMDWLGAAAKIAGAELESAEGLPLDAKSLMAKTDNLFADALTNKMNATLAGPSGVAPTQLSTSVHVASQANSANPAHLAAQYIDTPVQDARWGDAVAQRVSMMLGKQEQQIEMQLNPPNLGPMEVRLNLGSEQASVIFTSQHAAVREALAAATPKLTALLADQGIVLQNVQVASDSLQQHQQNAFAQQQQRSDTPYGSANVGLNVAQQNSQVAERLHTLNELRVPVGSTRVSLFV
ncbi:flagellar hook-length control protein FliK [Chitinibacter sp. SCUT-21]|uniref:flagellar hook-length control protein FliK n=1 Tax=Chitinibacter sp. SCUT-21 TaxID=2970891 RepID=UPI0035A6BC48